MQTQDPPQSTNFHSNIPTGKSGAETPSHLKQPLLGKQAPDAGTVDTTQKGNARHRTSGNPLIQAVKYVLLFPKRPRTPASLSAWYALLILLLTSALFIGLRRLMVTGEASFYSYSVLFDAGITFVTLSLLWLGVEASAKYLPPHLQNIPHYDTRRLSSVFGMMILATIPSSLMALGLEYLPSAIKAQLIPKAWLDILRDYSMWIWGAPFVYWVAVLGQVLHAHFHKIWIALPITLLIAGFNVFAGFQLPYQHWYPERDAAEYDSEQLELSQAVFEKQIDIFSDSVLNLPSGIASEAELFAIVYAPHANDGKVFLNESELVKDVLGKRYDAAARTVQLVNHASTTDSLAWATPTNLRRTVAVIAKKMNRDEDVLMIYATSHGGRNATLSSSHWPLSVDELTAKELAKILDDYNIRYRVIAISACYSGSWIDALANANTLLMTAADAKNTSYGCGRLSDMTFFGRALFDEQLRKNQTIEQAFMAAKPIIKQREEEAGKDDGFSNPQLRMGKNIKPVLQRLEAQHGR